MRNLLLQSTLEADPYYWDEDLDVQTTNVTRDAFKQLSITWPRDTGHWLDKCFVEAHIFDTLNYTDGSPNTYTLSKSQPMWAVVWSHDPDQSEFHPHFHDFDIVNLSWQDRMLKGIPKCASYKRIEVFSIGFYKLDNIILIKALKMNGHIRRHYNNGKHIDLTKWFLDKFITMTKGYTIVSLEAEAHRRYCRDNKLSMVPDYGFDKRMFKKAGFQLQPIEQVLAAHWDDMNLQYSDLNAWVLNNGNQH